jgi:hypothetical protein
VDLKGGHFAPTTKDLTLHSVQGQDDKLQ